MFNRTDKVNGMCLVKYFLLFFFLSLSFSLFSQDYYAYYEFVKKGRGFVAEEDYEAALEAYEACFESFDFVFARDCIHALQVASVLKDKDAQLSFSARALRQGVPLTFLEKMEVLKGFRASTYWDSLLQAEDSLVLQYQSTIDTLLREEIRAMFTQDQLYREEYYGSLFRRRSIGKKWEALNADQVERILQICREKGFPGEQLIGLDSEQFHEKLTINNLSSGAATLLFIHHYSQPNPSCRIELKEQLKQGYLNNEHFATICDFEAEFGKGIYVDKLYWGQQFLPDKNIQMEAIDQRRDALGLVSLNLSDKLLRSGRLIPFWKRLY